MEKEKKYINSIQEFIEVIDKLSIENPHVPRSCNPDEELFLYRGHSVSGWKLTPQLRRMEDNGENGHEVLNHSYGVYTSEKSMLLDFIQESSPYVQTIDSTDYLNWTIIAQHHGMPTRLLDWSANPLVGMFFACAENEKEEGCVWICHTPNYRKHMYDQYEDVFTKQQNEKATSIVEEMARDLLFTTLDLNNPQSNHPDIPVLLYPQYLDQRMALQASRFMVWAETEKPLEIIADKMMFPIDARNDRATIYAPFLCCVYIKPERKWRLLKQLEMLGITDRTVFPGLDGIGRYLNRKYKFNYQETLSRF